MSSSRRSDMPSGTSAMPGVADGASELDQRRAGLRAVADVGEGGRRRWPRSRARGQRLDVVDHGRLGPTARRESGTAGAGRAGRACSRSRGAARSPRRRRAAGSADDLDVEVEAGAERVGAQVTRLFGGLDRGSSRRWAVVMLARTAMKPRARTDGEGGEGEPLDDGVRVGLHERPVELGAGVGLEAVGDDVPNV